MVVRRKARRRVDNRLVEPYSGGVLTGYAYGVPWPTCAVAGMACSVSGMLPDLDSASGKPAREILCLLAAVVPALMIPRFQQLGLQHEHLVLAVHMMQVAEATLDQDVECTLVTQGIPQEELRAVGLSTAVSAQEALERAFERLGRGSRVAVLRHAAEMLPLVGD